MNDEQLARNLQSVGMSCFVKYFDNFISVVVDRVDTIELLKNENNYTDKSCKSRMSHALAIINSGHSVDALKMVVSSTSGRVSKDARITANKYIARMM